MKSGLVINPGKTAGGSNLLFARTMKRLQGLHGHELTLVDYEDGATRKAWVAEGIPHTFFEYNSTMSYSGIRADYVLINLLGAKLIGPQNSPPLTARFISWCTAPQDPFKFLPPAYLLNKASWGKKEAFAKLFFRSHRRRISNFLIDGSRRGGVVFMDDHCHEVNEALWGPGIPRHIVPICTDIPSVGPRFDSPRTGRAHWVGRITDFKTESLVAMTRALLKQGSPIKEVVVIGDGADMSSARERLAELNINWLGYLTPEKLDSELMNNADIVYGHGTALLEAAKLGIPSLLVDGTYEQIDQASLRAEWLHRCPAGYVGRIDQADHLFGRSIEECLSEYMCDSKKIAEADFGRWKAVHHPNSVAEKLADVIANGDYTVKDFIESGASRPGWFGLIIECAKRSVFRRRY